MRALLCSSLDHGIDGLQVGEAEAPSMAEGGVRLRVHAAGVNFADTLIVRGRYQLRPELPFAPGMEAAGVVLEVDGAAASDVRPGQRVLALLDHGGFAEEAVARASDVCAIPDSMDFATAAAFPVAYATAYLALAERARLEAGEVLLVYGASGGVGLTAVEVGKALGARVIAVASSADKLRVARERGADQCIEYTREDVRERVLALTGGADVVFDPVGGALFEAALRCIKPAGRILVIGFASGDVPQIPANHLLVKDASALGFSLGQVRRHRPDRVQAGLARLVGMYERGLLRPLVSEVLPLERAADGLRTVAAGRAVGKIVVQVAGD